MAATSALGLLLAVGWFVWLRPTTLGGRQTYIIVQGSSMEPTYHDGDLVIVREEDSYATGDIIAFRMGGVFDTPTRVIHRIVGPADADSFLTRGDNRDRLDPWRPGPDEIIGRATLHVPHAGDIAAAAGRPPVLAALGGAAVMLGRNRRRRRPTPPVAPDTAVPSTLDAGPGTPGSTPVAESVAPAGHRLAPLPRWRRHTEPRWAVIGLVACGLLSVPVLLGCWSAIQASTQAVRIHEVGTIEQAISLDYRFVGEPSAVYPTGVVGTVERAAGTRAPAEPLFTRLLRRVEVAVDFKADVAGAERSTTTYGADVVLATPEGVTRTITSEPPLALEGGATRVLVVDLFDVAARVQEINSLTGIDGPEYTIRFTPTLLTEASSGGATATKTLAPTIEFVVRDGVIEAQPLTDSTGVEPIVRQVAETTRYRMGPIALETPTARGLLSGLALVLVVGAGWFASVVFGGMGLKEADRIAVRYRAQLVDVSAATSPPGPVVMVGGIGELARLAKVDGSVILHEDLGDGAHRYRVFLGAVTYEYETAPESAAGAMDASSESLSDEGKT